MLSNQVLKRFLLLSLFLTTLCSYAAEDSAAENLAKQDGVKVTADSFYNSYKPYYVVDGNDKDMKSRWVSKNTPGGHWLMLSFKKPITFNTVVMKFYNNNYVATDFTLEHKTEQGWKELAKITGNKLQAVRVVFAMTTAKEIRAVFHKTTTDNMVRLYEFEVYKSQTPVTLKMRSVDGNELSSSEYVAEIYNFSDKELKLNMQMEISSISNVKKKMIRPVRILL